VPFRFEYMTPQSLIVVFVATIISIVVFIVLLVFFIYWHRSVDPYNALSEIDTMVTINLAIVSPICLALLVSTFLNFTAYFRTRAFLTPSQAKMIYANLGMLLTILITSFLFVAINALLFARPCPLFYDLELWLKLAVTILTVIILLLFHIILLEHIIDLKQAPKTLAVTSRGAIYLPSVLLIIASIVVESVAATRFIYDKNVYSLNPLLREVTCALLQSGTQVPFLCLLPPPDNLSFTLADFNILIVSLFFFMLLVYTVIAWKNLSKLPHAPYRTYNISLRLFIFQSILVFLMSCKLLVEVWRHWFDAMIYNN